MVAHRHLTSTTQLAREWMDSELFPLCEQYREGESYDRQLRGKSLYCLFYEPSFLTRTSFERAIEKLGGKAYHTEDASQFFPVNTPRYIDNIIGILASLHIDLVVLRSSEPGVVDKAESSDALPIINGGSRDDHPTQALADLYTLRRELGGLDGVSVAVVGRLEHRNVSALLRALALFEGVSVTLLPFSGQADPDVIAYCERLGMELTTASGVDALTEVDAIYLNGPRTLAHAQLLRSRGALNLRIDADFMSGLRANCVILDPMQRSGDFDVQVRDRRLAFYRQAENALFVRMALLSQMLVGGNGPRG
jgi:aspartate carbamoyltransferase catalytic subunit